MALLRRSGAARQETAGDNAVDNMTAGRLGKHVACSGGATGHGGGAVVMVQQGTTRRRVSVRQGRHVGREAATGR